MNTSEFLAFLTSHDATAALGESLTTLILARRAAATTRAVLVASQSDDSVRVAS